MPLYRMFACLLCRRGTKTTQSYISRKYNKNFRPEYLSEIPYTSSRTSSIRSTGTQGQDCVYVHTVKLATVAALRDFWLGHCASSFPVEAWKRCMLVPSAASSLRESLLSRDHRSCWYDPMGQKDAEGYSISTGMPAADPPLRANEPYGAVDIDSVSRHSV